ncbi:nitrate/nitrite two-component system sensor histidine kinase NarQ [Pantoea allii]|uniref:Sensor protein n=1 Tax=Pantoea allii TaxID=574096 RepID=A0ABS6VEH1_9GAMM|nr:nitrate/nitrite two-component system sensor histidine kinase NarQ [Pantoea allii]MBW1257712.1 nitrate/nitrite two-component system sensor histidine kinase NarQ [Pantoea allii]MBW1266723.1 nitrate/nitrite two-component system sensor histidine kinase NarQ [Pantoea allii]MBW1288694.1 nitrate/nitrite two-component system sensor histidine kinase NarQ [Pantoea allii]
MIVKRSVTRSIAQSLTLIVLLALLTTGLALLTLSSSLRDAEAINLAGSLRMQSYRLAWDARLEPQLLANHLVQFQQTLDASVLQQLDRPWVPRKVIDHYQRLRVGWPVLAQHLHDNAAQAWRQQMPAYVGEIDRFVLELQRYAELKMRVVAVSSLTGVVAIVALALMTIRFTRQQVVKPLNALVTASRYVESGNFAFPPLHVQQQNELKVLSHTFSSMAAQLQSHYQILEQRVRDKTRDLTQANHTLSLLYESSQILTRGPLHPALFDNVLANVRARENLAFIRLEGESFMFASGQIDPSYAWHHLPLQQDGQPIGTLRWQTTVTTPPKALMRSLAAMLGRSLWIWQTQKQHQQMLLLEERATIARELHDSLAQALTYLRIQLTLLRRTVDAGDRAAHDIIAEFDRALAEAYRQLRELLATFRLTIEKSDLVAALQAMIASLQEQSAAEIQFTCQPGLQDLDAQQQVHVLQIAREALLNAIRHASAQVIIIDYQHTEKGEHVLTVTDDGIGIGSTEEPPGHYGLTTMTERAERLAGSLQITALQRGTRVALRFPPRLAQQIE